jgi:hypothetical protein
MTLFPINMGTLPITGMNFAPTQGGLNFAPTLGQPFYQVLDLLPGLFWVIFTRYCTYYQVALSPITR